MASLSSKISSAAKSAANKITSTVSSVKNAGKSAGTNLAKQAAALSGSLTANAASAKTPAYNMTNASTMKPAVAPAPKAPNMTSAVTRQPVNSAVAPKAPNMTSAATRQPVNSSSAPKAPNMTDSRTMQPTRGVSSGSSNSNPLSNAYNALQRSLGGNSTAAPRSYASDGGPGVSNNSGIGLSGTSADTYRGNAGRSLTSYYSGQPLSLEAQANQSQAPAPEATPESRDQNRAVITEWESSAPQREAQVADLTSQIREIQAAKDAMATAPIDPLMPEDQFLAQLREEEERYAEQEEELQREIERLTKPSAEYLEAQRLEDELTAKEAAINAGVNRTTAEIADQPIPYGFVTGQSAAVERRANADLQTIAAQKIPLQQRLANEQARRAAALDVVKTSSTRAINRRDTASDRRFDYQTDEKKRKEDRVDQAQKDRYVSVGDGSQLYDTVTGKVVSNNPKNFSPNSSSSSTDTTDAGVNGLIRGNDGYVDPYEYAKLRAQAKSANEFDRKYSYLMNPVSRPKFGLGESGA